MNANKKYDWVKVAEGGTLFFDEQEFDILNIRVVSWNWAKNNGYKFTCRAHDGGLTVSLKSSPTCHPVADVAGAHLSGSPADASRYVSEDNELLPA